MTPLVLIIQGLTVCSCGLGVISMESSRRGRPDLAAACLSGMVSIGAVTACLAAVIITGVL